MEEKQTQQENLREKETHILSQIVDAMLAAEKDLSGASVDEWTRILVDSCRQQKVDSQDRQLALLAGC
jgi:hypothetical protein